MTPHDRHGNQGWLNSGHSFSFVNCYGPSHMRSEALRVINGDAVQPGQALATRVHRDMEIICYGL